MREIWKKVLKKQDYFCDIHQLSKNKKDYIMNSYKTCADTLEEQ